MGERSPQAEWSSKASVESYRKKRAGGHNSVTQGRCTEVAALGVPNEGWIRTARKALRMTGAQLAKRSGVSGAFISRSEFAELDDSVTLRNLRKFAESMDCRLVYAIVPKTSVDEIIDQQANRKAHSIVNKASVHMSLENQALNKFQLSDEIQRVKEEILRSGNSKLWNE